MKLEVTAVKQSIAPETNLDKTSKTRQDTDSSSLAAATTLQLLTVLPAVLEADRSRYQEDPS
jgi:hypothetical protein